MHHGGLLLSASPTPRRPCPPVQAAAAAQRPLPGWAAALVALVLPAICVRMLGPALIPQITMLASLAAPEDPLSVAATELGATLIILGPLLLVAAASMRLIEVRPQAVGAVKPLRSALWGGALGLVALLAALGAALAASTFSVRISGISAVAAASAVVIVLMQASIEEYFFRGWLQPILAARWGRTAGLVCAALLFSAAHAWDHGISVLAYLNDALAGLAFGLLAARTGSLWAPIAAHFAWNFTEANVLGAFPNPGLDPLGSAYDIDFFGSGLWTGGSEALNGALGTTFALLALAAVVAYRGPRADSSSVAAYEASGVH